MAPPPNPQHCQIDPMFAWLGDTMKITFDGSPPDAADVVVKVTDVAANYDELVTEIKGSFKGGAFVAAGAGSTNKKAVTTEDTKIDLEVGGKTHTVYVLTRQRPNRACELHVEVLVGGKSVYTANPPAMFVARTAPPAGRQRITFLVRSPSEAYFDAAETYWKTLNFTVVQKSSWKEIVETLEAGVGNVKGPWGEVNVVTHGNEVQVNCPLETGGDDWITSKDVDRAKGKIAAWKKLDKVLDGTSYVVIRGCNIGNNSDLLDQLKKVVLQDKCTLFAPLHYQHYEYVTQTGKIALAWESLTERLFHYHDGSGGAGTDAEHEKQFDAKHPGLAWATEKSTFSTKQYVYKATLTSTTPESNLYVEKSDDWVRRPDTEAEWKPVVGPDAFKNDPEEYMKRAIADWKFGGNPTVSKTKNPVDDEIALLCSTSTSPVVIVVATGGVDVGAAARSGDPGWPIAGLLDHHSQLFWDGKGKPVRVEVGADPTAVANVTHAGATKKLTTGQKGTFAVGDTLVLVGTKSATITARLTNEHEVLFAGMTTTCEVRRRELRVDSTTKPWSDRPTVVPDWTGSNFASA